MRGYVCFTCSHELERLQRGQRSQEAAHRQHTQHHRAGDRRLHPPALDQPRHRRHRVVVGGSRSGRRGGRGDLLSNDTQIGLSYSRGDEFSDTVTEPSISDSFCSLRECILMKPKRRKIIAFYDNKLDIRSRRCRKLFIYGYTIMYYRMF